MSVPVVAPGPQQQYLRECRLLCSDITGQSIDLSAFRIKFQVKRTNVNTPNTAVIRVYNLSQQTAIQVGEQFIKVYLDAGYQSQHGVIFRGDIKQVIIGAESATDTFIEIIASDGDLAYNFAIVNATIAAGATSQQQVNACATAMAALGTTAGNNTVVPSPSALPRGKVLYGNAKDYLRQTAKTTNTVWSIQNEQIVFIPIGGYLPGEAVLINSNTGMIGSPQQTLEGVNVKTLLNPQIVVGTRIQLDNASINRLPINLSISPPAGVISSAQAAAAAAASIPAELTTDGVYFVWVAEFTGDTRGIEWYTTILGGYTDPTIGNGNGVAV